MSAVCLLERFLEEEGAGAIYAQPYESYPLAPSTAFFDYDVIRKYVRERHYAPRAHLMGDADSLTRADFPTRTVAESGLNDNTLKVLHCVWIIEQQSFWNHL